MGGKAAGEPVFDGATGLLPNGVGALLDMGGKAADEVVLDAAATAGLLPNGVGALFDMD